MPITISGYDKSNLLNYPPYTVATVFLSRCNFRCPYCQNPDLVLDSSGLAKIEEKDFLAFMDKRIGWLEGVCITGGEPTIHKELPGFIGKLKAKGFLVKLDTNGTNPKMLSELLKSRQVDYVAMDIKAPKEKYSLVTKAKADLQAIQESIHLIQTHAPAYEFRTTVAKELLSPQDLLLIGKWLSGSHSYVLQQFRKSPHVMDMSAALSAYTKEEMGQIQDSLKPYFGKVSVRDA